MLLIILAWILWFGICFNIGFFLLRIFYKEKHRKIDFFYNFWFGIFLLIPILGFISLFYPLNEKVFWATIIFGIMLFAINFKKFPKPFLKFDYKKVILFGLLIVIISFLSNQMVVWCDTYLYHFNAVKWLTDYGTVKGLANLHDRFGVNNATFILGGIMNNWIFRDSVSHITNSLLFIVLTLQFVDCLFSKQKNSLFFIFSLFSLLILSLFIGQISSLSTDFGLMIFVLVSTYYTFIFSKDKDFLMLAIPLYTLAATTKYSYFIALIFMGIFIVVKLKREIFSKTNISILFITLFYFLAFVARNLILSGWPFFPMTIFGIHLQWQVPAELAKRFSDIVTAWARLPGPDYVKMMNVNFLQWFPTWFMNNRGNLFYLVSIPPLLIAHLFSKGKERFGILDFLILVNLVALFYTFMTAPDMRFMSIFIYVEIALILSIFLERIVGNKGLRSILVLLFVFAIVGNLLNKTNLTYTFSWVNIYKDFGNDIGQMTIKYADQSFHVWRSTNDTQCGCGNSVLPCTPYISGFKMISPGDIANGFYSTNENFNSE